MELNSQIMKVFQLDQNTEKLESWLPTLFKTTIHLSQQSHYYKRYNPPITPQLIRLKALMPLKLKICNIRIKKLH